MLQVHYDEGIANRIGPESCAGTREGAGEALTGVCIGQPLSRESDLLSGADAVLLAVVPLPIIFSTIGPSKDSNPMFFIIVKVSFIKTTVRPF